MLTDEIEKQSSQEQADKQDAVTINIGSDPVMQSALDVLSILGKNPIVRLKAKGNSIPNAVAVANIITEKMLHGNSTIQKVTVDTDKAPGIGNMLSTVEIIVKKITAKTN